MLEGGAGGVGSFLRSDPGLEFACAVLTVFGEVGHRLDRRRARTDDSHALVAELGELCIAPAAARVIVVPAGSVEHLALEAVNA